VTGTQSASLKNAPISYYTRYLRAPSARVHPFRRILTACCCIAKIFRYLMFGDSADPGSSDHMQLLTQEKRALHAYLKSYEKWAPYGSAVSLFLSLSISYRSRSAIFRLSRPCLCLCLFKVLVGALYTLGTSIVCTVVTWWSRRTSSPLLGSTKDTRSGVILILTLRKILRQITNYFTFSPPILFNRF